MVWVRLFLGVLPMLAVLFVGVSLRNGIAGVGARAQARVEAKAQAASSAATLTVATETARSQAEIRWRTRTIHDEVPAYVTPEADRRGDVPVGFVRLHDAAAAGVLPEPAGGADDAPSGVALSAVAATVADNYGTCLGAFDRLSRLQGWIKDQQRTFGGK